MQQTWIIQLIGILVVLLLLSFSIPWTTSVLSNMIAQQAQQGLHDEGLTWAKVQSNDRNIVISGTTSNIDQYQKALQIGRSLWYVKQVEDQVSVDIIKPYMLNIQRDRTTVSIKGHVSSDKDKVNIKQKLATDFDDKNIQADLQIGAGAPEQWEQLANVLIDKTTTFKLVSIQMVDKTVTIAGKVATHGDIETLNKATEPFQKHGYTFSSRVIALDNAAVVCQKEFNRLLSQESIRFELGSTTIDESSYALLTELADAAIFCAHSVIRITGYTDNMGDDEENLRLSEQRAKVVKGWLFTEHGIPLERLKTQGKGANEPIASNDTEEGRAKNRRIEFIVDGL